MRQLPQDDVDSADDGSQQMSSESSKDMNETSVDNYNSMDDQDNERNSQRSGFVAPRARKCNTGKSP